TALDQQELERGKLLLELTHRLQVRRRVFTDRRVRASARLDADDPLRRQRAAPHEELGVFLRVDVVGDDRHVELGREPAAERLGQRGLPGADGAADADLQGTWSHAHERNSRESSVAWRIPAISIAGLKLHRSSAVFAASAAAARRSMRSRIAASTRCPSSWPSAISRRPAPTRSSAGGKREAPAAGPGAAPPRPTTAPNTLA